ncbi:hypothetical protein RDABS01_011360 [Bienertia sinuspersici]
MTLEDFFTLTEMKDGFTAPARVEELITVMQKEKILWLKDAQTFPDEASDCFVEEAISALLQAVEKLQVDGDNTDAEKAPDNNDLKLDRQDPESQCTAKDVSPTNLLMTRSWKVLEWKKCAHRDGVLDFECVTSPKQATKGVISECLKPESLVEDAKHDNQVDMLPDTDRLGNIVVTSASVVSDSKDVTRTDAKAVEEIAENIKDESLMETTSACDTNNPVRVSSDGMDDSEQIGLEKEDDEHNELNRYHKSERRFLGSSCELLDQQKSSKTTDIIRQTQDMDLEDGTVDALEVARLVAKEVEQEVHDSPKSINREQDLEVDGPVNQLSATENAPDASAKAPSKTAADLETLPKTIHKIWSPP